MEHNTAEAALAEAATATDDEQAFHGTGDGSARAPLLTFDFVTNDDSSASDARLF